MDSKEAAPMRVQDAVDSLTAALRAGVGNMGALQADDVSFPPFSLSAVAEWQKCPAADLSQWNEEWLEIWHLVHEMRDAASFLQQSMTCAALLCMVRQEMRQACPTQKARATSMLCPKTVAIVRGLLSLHAILQAHDAAQSRQDLFPTALTSV